jgi:transcriptional regulator with XRE-family HTH domain
VEEADATEAGSVRFIIGPRSLGEAIRLLQARAGLTRDELARRAGISTGAASNYLNDSTLPSAGILRRIGTALATALHEDPDQLWLQLGEVLDGQITLRQEMREMGRAFGEEGMDGLWSAFGRVVDDGVEELLASWSRSASQTLPPDTYETYYRWIERCAAMMRETPLDQVTAMQIYSCLLEISAETGARVEAQEAMAHFYGWLNTPASPPAARKS